MVQLNDRVRAVLESQALWHLGTCSDEPEITMIGFKEILDDGRIVLCDVLMKKTKANILANGKACIAVANAETMEGYQINGTAEYLTDGPLMEVWKENALAFSGGRMPANGVVVFTPESVRIASPSKTNGKLLE